MKAVLAILGVFVGLIILTFVSYGFAIAMGWATVPFHQAYNRQQTAHDVIDQSVNAQNCLQWQDWFRTQEGTIQTLKATVDNAQADLDTFNKEFPDPSKWTDSQAQQHDRLMQNLTGAKNETNDAINSYNAKSAQENFAVCKSGLPVHIQPF